MSSDESDAGGDGDSRDPLEDALDAIALLDAEQRSAYLKQLRQHHPELAERVRALAAAADSLGELDAGPDLVADDLTETHATLPPGTRLGAWRVLELLGRGGMGRVYLAERADGAFEKQAAIKVLRHERRLPEAILEHERALLARLEHPGVSRLLDGGISADGDAFLVMELVRGESLQEWCQRHDSTLEQRLEVFEQILRAVGYAHRQRVVHGDLKPDNIYIDRHGRVRVLDFGVAQILAADAAPAAHGLTPRWAAPECRDGDPPQVASDIYSLGLLLEFLAADASGRAQPPKDLVAIIAHATDADPETRYDTVMGLRLDLGHFRRHEPVQARGGGRLYLASRFLRRHWFGTSFAVLLATIVVVAGGVIIHQNRIVRSERDSARLAAARSQTVLDYLLSIVGKATNIGEGNSRSLNTLLQDSLRHIDADFGDDSAARQALLARLGELLVHLGDYSAAEKVLERFRIDAANTAPRLRARALDNLALIRVHQGHLDQAMQLIRQALATLKQVAADHQGAHSQLLVTRARIETRQGKVDTAIATLHQALALRLAVSPDDAAQSVVVRNSLAVALMRSGQYGVALEEFRQLAAALESSGRDRSLDAATIVGNHASTAFAYGRYREAERLFDKALALQSTLYGPSARLAALLNNAGKLDLALGHTRRGRRQIRRAVDMMQEYAGADSIDAQLIGLSLGAVALATGEPHKAVNIYRNLGTSLANKIGAEHPLVTRIQALQMVARARIGQIPAGDTGFDALAAKLAKTPRGHRPLAQLQCARAALALRQAVYPLARDSASSCMQTRRQHLDPASPPLLIARYLAARAQGRLAQAHQPESSPDALLAQLRAKLGDSNPVVLRLAAL